MLKTVETVREREREDNSRELSLINYAQNTAIIMVTIAIAIIVVNGKESTKINRIESHEKDGLYSNEKFAI